MPAGRLIPLFQRDLMLIPRSLPRGFFTFLDILRSASGIAVKIPQARLKRDEELQQKARHYVAFWAT